eukprot:jgi/Botrbrau1/9038/Bobra.0376s0015.1
MGDIRLRDMIAEPPVALEFEGRDADKLEVEYDLWLASKRLVADFTSLLLALVYLLSYIGLNRTLLGPHVIPLGAITTCVFVSGLLLIAWRPDRYSKVRQYLFAVVWYFVSIMGLSSHLLVERALDGTRQPAVAFVMLMGLKVPVIILLFTMFPVKLAWAPLVQFLTLAMFSIGSHNAAARHEEDLSQNVWVQSLTQKMNGALGACVSCAVRWLVASGILRCPITEPLQILSPRQSVLAMWLAVQGVVFWACLWGQLHEETIWRKEFLHSICQVRNLNRSVMIDMMVQLGVLHVYLFVYLVLCINAWA